MRIFIVDTNLLFSAIRNVESPIARFILDAKRYDVDLYAPTYLLGELERHFDTLVENSSLTKTEAKAHKEKIVSSVNFVDDASIPMKYWFSAARWTRDVDDDDTAFVALNEKLDAFIWTGDVKLYKGLKAKGYERIVNFREVKVMLKLPTDF